MEILMWILGYVFIAVATFLAFLKAPTKQDLIVSIICGFIWPLFFTARLIAKLLK